MGRSALSPFAHTHGHLQVRQGALAADQGRRLQGLSPRGVRPPTGAQLEGPPGHPLLTYQTKRAKEICEWVNTKILNQDGQRIFFFRGETEEWSNVSLLSTDAAPLLTADPVYTIEKTVDVLTACPAVSKVTITDVHGRELTLAEVRARPLESHSRLLPSCPDCVSLLSHVSRPRRWNSARSTATRRL